MKKTARATTPPRKKVTIKTRVRAGARSYALVDGAAAY